MERDASYMTNEALSNKVAEHDVRIATLETNQKEMQSKVDDIHDIATSVKVMAQDMQYIKEDVSEVKSAQKADKQWKEEFGKKLSDVEQAPLIETAKKANALKEKIIWAIVSGVLVFLLTQAFPNIFK